MFTPKQLDEQVKAARRAALEAAREAAETVQKAPAQYTIDDESWEHGYKDGATDALSSIEILLKKANDPNG